MSSGHERRHLISSIQLGAHVLNNFFVWISVFHLTGLLQSKLMYGTAIITKIYRGESRTMTVEFNSQLNCYFLL